ncbi:MAG: M56 family metallopeptidase [Verrucomicrobiota bacterium]
MIESIETIFLRLFEISWQASVLALVVFLVQKLFSRWLNPRWFYILWLLVIMRLLLPVVPESPVSGYQYLPQAPINQASDFERGGAMEADHLVPSQNKSIDKELEVTEVSTSTKSSSRPLSVIQAISLFWFLGIFVLISVILVRSYRLKRKMDGLTEVNEVEIKESFEEACRTLKIKRAPRLLKASFVSSPCLVGLFRACILLPESSMRIFSPQELRLVLLHELAHHKRGDLVVQWLLTWLQVIHWFNPVLWLAFRLIRADQETATDAMVLNCAGAEEKKNYGNALLRLLESFQNEPRAASMIGILEEKKEIKRRFSLISSFTQKAYAWSSLAVILMLVLAAVFLTKETTNAAIDEGDSAISLAQVGEWESRIIESAREGDGERIMQTILESFENPISVDKSLVHEIADEFWADREYDAFKTLLIQMRMTNVGKDWLPTDEQLTGILADGYTQFVDLLLLDYAKPLPFERLTGLGGEIPESISLWIKTRVEQVKKKREDETSLVRAAAKNNLEKINRLLDAGVNINCVSAKKPDTPLVVAARFGKIEAVRLLLERGAEVDLPRHPGWDYTALCLAKDVPTAELLKSYGANVHAKLYKRDVSILTYVARWNDVDQVHWFLNQGLDPHMISDNNETLLFDAGNGKTMRLLLEKGLDPNHKNDFGLTPIVRVQDAESVEALIEHGAKLDVTEDPLINMMVARYASADAIGMVLEKIQPRPEGNDLQQALIAAVHSDRDDVVQVLLKHGADPNQKAVRDPETSRGYEMYPMTAATVWGSPKSAKILLEHGCNPNGRDHPAQFIKNAVRNGHLEVAKLLREAGAQGLPDLAYHVSQKDRNAIELLLDNAPYYSENPEFWQSTVIEASRIGDLKTLQDSFAKGVPLFEEKEALHSSDNPYRVAAEEGQHETLQVLFNQGEYRNQKRWLADALWGAIWNCNPYERQRSVEHFEKTIEILLEAGAPIKAKNEEENFVSTAVFTRNPGGNGNVIRMLVAAGADPNPVVQDGRRLVDYIRTTCQEDCQIPSANTLDAIEEVNGIKLLARK